MQPSDEYQKYLEWKQEKEATIQESLDEHRIHTDPETFIEEELNQEVEQKLDQLDQDVELQKQKIDELQQQEDALMSKVKEEDIDDPWIKQIASEVADEVK